MAKSSKSSKKSGKGKGGRKKPRTAAQKAATKRMLDALCAKRGGKKSGKKSGKSRSKGHGGHGKKGGAKKGRAKARKNPTRRRRGRPASQLTKAKALITRATKRARKGKGDVARRIRGRAIISTVRRKRGKGYYTRLTMSARLNPRGAKKESAKGKARAKRAEKSAAAAANVASKAKTARTAGKASAAGLKALKEGLAATNARIDGVEKRVTATEGTLKVHSHHLHTVRLRVAQMQGGEKFTRKLEALKFSKALRQQEADDMDRERRKLSARLIPR